MRAATLFNLALQCLPLSAQLAGTLPQNFATAALAARNDFRLKAYLERGRYPEDTHFDELDWVNGFSELWLYAVRNARLALAANSTAASKLKSAEEILLEAAARGKETGHHRAWRQARKALDEHLALLKTLRDEVSELPQQGGSISGYGHVNRTVTLSNGIEMPTLGLGTTMLNEEKGEAAILRALQLGYRLVDTAQAYGNEAEVGRALKSSGVLRQDVFLATKLSDDNDCARKRAKKRVKAQLKLLGTEYIDQYMLHGPCPGMKGAWKDLEELYHAGVLRSLGVSNFDLSDLERFTRTVTVKPHVVQNKFSVYHRGWAPVDDERDLPAALHRAGIVLMGYCNLDAYPHVLQPLQDAHVQRVAAAHGRTAAQVLLRHALQHGTVVIPKSEREERLKENSQIYDFLLSDSDMRYLDALPWLAYNGKPPAFIEDFFQVGLGGVKSEL